MGREVGGGFRMGNTCTPMVHSCQCMAKPIQYCKVISLQLNKFMLKKEKNPIVAIITKYHKKYTKKLRELLYNDFYNKYCPLLKGEIFYSEYTK